MTNELLKKLGIEHPIIQGPFGGGPSTPELVAAVSNAGGLGSLGAAYQTPDQITETIRRIRALTDRPFQVNLFAGGWQTDMQFNPAPMLEVLSEIHATLGLPAPLPPQPAPDPFPAQFEAVIDAQPPVFSFTFGIPDRDAMSRLKSRGIVVMGTATTLDEARRLADAGVDAIVAQGAEAGAHRGTFAGPFDHGMVPTLSLTSRIHGALQTPVVATGGLMDGQDIAGALEAGASAAALGTAFLASPESGAPEAYKRAVVEADRNSTVITRAFSGRPARGLRNDFISRLEGKETSILPYPLQNALTRAMRTAAGQQGLAGFLSLWAGTGVARAGSAPAGELVVRLVEELHSSVPPR
ncbi:MAG TPA: nitronate monooxygenase [Bryobacteraceae bacterium]|jgi:nitronate monooxygenase|nr:nitronate monooxygenase [Bryobacteraceae bacterium]